MKKLLLSIVLSLGAISISHAQCSVEVNDSLLANYDYVLNATNQTGMSPFVYNWTVTDGNGMPITYTTSSGSDSVTIDAATLQNSYGCIIYQLCMTDMMGCSTCTGDTSMVTVPYPCYSQFNSSIVGTNQVSITLNSSMPPFMITSQIVMWTDGDGTGQGAPYMGPGTIINYVPGSNQSNKFFCCILTNTFNGGCISCDSIQYTNSGLGIQELGSRELRISPNPASVNTTIESTASIEEIIVYNAFGQLVPVDYTLDNSTAKLTVSGLAKGIYIVRVRTALGTFEERLVKE
jgi:hypothetical protein